MVQGIIGTVGVSPGFISPLVVGFITSNQVKLFLIIEYLNDGNKLDTTDYDYDRIKSLSKYWFCISFIFRINNYNIINYNILQKTLSRWSKVFYLSGAICIITGLIFIIFGSSKVQKWNAYEVQMTNDSEMKLVSKKSKSVNNTLKH